jgi:GTP-binding protein Era
MSSARARRASSSDTEAAKIKRIGIEARKDIEKFFEKHVYLELLVKVEKDWRNQEDKLRAFGYIE